MLTDMTAAIGALSETMRLGQSEGPCQASRMGMLVHPVRPILLHLSQDKRLALRLLRFKGPKRWRQARGKLGLGLLEPDPQPERL